MEEELEGPLRMASSSILMVPSRSKISPQNQPEESKYYTPSPDIETDCDDMPKLIDGASKTGIDSFTRSLKECEIQNLN